ncbi:MAG: hypothetical protein IPH07_07410 [Deltaproteobacteria bacterium]|nr:hypothetical protein [Deltaproteobacteria bacterium]MBK8717812.1 hypothetical protein [Deltaproteobacteria bacterium]MBP7287827.1 hypothetical protein [Nannocystaceae bacterium]
MPPVESAAPVESALPLSLAELVPAVLDAVVVTLAEPPLESAPPSSSAGA